MDSFKLKTTEAAYVFLKIVLCATLNTRFLFDVLYYSTNVKQNCDKPVLIKLSDRVNRPCRPCTPLVDPVYCRVVMTWAEAP